LRRKRTHATSINFRYRWLLVIAQSLQLLACIRCGKLVAGVLGFIFVFLCDSKLNLTQ
jgi:hypothetical protein